MFKNNNRKQKQSIKEMVKMKNILICMIFVVVAFCATTSAWAALVAGPITVNVGVPEMSGAVTVSISKVTGTDWLKNQTSISFGELVWDVANNHFGATSYYVMDVGVADNTADWSVAHTRVSLANGTNNLDDKVNVTFVKQTSDTASTPLDKLSFGNSNNVSYTKAQLAGGWLRISYGVGTGLGDAPGVTAIGLDTPALTYTGSVTITLTP